VTSSPQLRRARRGQAVWSGSNQPYRTGSGFPSNSIGLQLALLGVAGVALDSVDGTGDSLSTMLDTPDSGAAPARAVSHEESGLGVLTCCGAAAGTLPIRRHVSLHRTEARRSLESVARVCSHLRVTLHSLYWLKALLTQKVNGRWDYCELMAWPIDFQNILPNRDNCLVWNREVLSSRFLGQGGSRHYSSTLVFSLDGSTRLQFHTVLRVWRF
jgi:hypothetical protein